MKDLIILTIAGVLLWWVSTWSEPAHSELVFQDNKAMVWITVFSF